MKLIPIKKKNGNELDVKPKKEKKEKKPKKVLTPEQEAKKKKHKRIRRAIGNFILGFIMFGGITVMVAIILFCGYIVVNAPEFDTDKLYNKEATIFYDRDGNEFARVGAEQRDLVYYNDLPDVLVDAIVATEDSRFFQHNGFDIVRFMKASLGQVVGQDGAGGASTLTMQVAKNAFSRDDSGKIESSGLSGIIRKFNDIYISVFKIEKNYTKEEIIEFYVNEPYLGSHTYGIEQASQKYFGKSVSDISLTEAALLAGIFNSPSAYNPFSSVALATKRRSIVLELMVRHGYITEEQANEARNISVESLLVDRSASTLNKYQTFIDMVSDEVLKRTGYDPYSTPMLVYTTLDPKIQDVMIALNDGSLGYEWKKSYMKTDFIQFGAAITDVNDGSIRAVNGGRNQTVERGYNRATMMKTQPGSTAKPIFAYGPYLEFNNGSTGTMFYDNKMTYSNGQILTNADNSYQGALTMRQALARSRNIPAVQAFMAVDKEKAAQFIKACGIDWYRYNDDGSVRDANLYESYAIGGGLQVSPLDMAAAYGTFARGGYYIEPYSFTKVIFRDTDEVYEHKYEKSQAMSAETAYMITDMLMTATAQGVGGNLRVSGTDIASKTGTSTYDGSAIRYYKIPGSASADNWVITYSPDYVISFWYGVDSLDPNDNNVYTDSTRAAIERVKISALIGNKIFKTNSRFTKPSGVISAKYEKETIPAELPSDYTPQDLISSELFKKGTEPSEVSIRFSQLANPTNGKGTFSNTQITLSWKEIDTPLAVDTTYLQKYFEDNYGQFASTYLTKRFDYNNKNIGNIGYQVYLSTANGLQSLGFTTNPYFVYQYGTPGTYTFLIKSSYSIFKANASSGISITVDTTNGLVPPGGDGDDDAGNGTKTDTNNEGTLD